MCTAVLYNPVVRKMTPSEYEELKKLHENYRRVFPNAEVFSLEENFTYRPIHYLAALREANGREIVFSTPDYQMGGGNFSFIEVSDNKSFNPITLQELLYSRNPKLKEARVKLVRHRDTSKDNDLYKLYRTNPQGFLEYQRQQGKKKGEKGVFDDCDYVVSFLGEEGISSRFIGVYRIGGVEYTTEAHFYYRMTEESGYEALKEKLIIKWPVAPINWHPWFNVVKPVEVLEIQNKPFSRPFVGYLDFTLIFAELKELRSSQGPRDEWRRMLSVVSGIYLILDTSTGKQYIGSAYGKTGGIWSRWVQYIDTEGHGGNTKLLELLAADVQHGRHLQFSILMTLPKSMPPKEVIEQEHLLMKKLGSRQYGLN